MQWYIINCCPVVIVYSVNYICSERKLFREQGGPEEGCWFAGPLPLHMPSVPLPNKSLQLDSRMAVLRQKSHCSGRKWAHPQMKPVGLKHFGLGGHTRTTQNQKQTRASPPKGRRPPQATLGGTSPDPNQSTAGQFPTRRE